MGWGWVKDLTVAATSMVPVAGPFLGGAVDGIWTGIENHSLSDGLKAAAVTTAVSFIPGGKIFKEFGVDTILGKTLGKLGANKIVGFIGNAATKKVAGGSTGKFIGAFANRSARGLEEAGGRVMGRGLAGGLSSALYNPGSNGSDKQAIPKVLPTRPAGKENRYAGAGTGGSNAVIGA